MPALEETPASPVDLQHFKDVQRLAYQCVEEVARECAAGTTEREASAKMRSWLLDHGVDGWFHVPFAWFGPRTAFEGVRFPWQFFPTGARLEEGMPFILDVAPVVDGYAADIGYAACLGHNAIFDRLRSDLPEYRALILKGVRAGRTLREVYEDVDALLARHGFANCHQRYPGHVLGHRVERVAKSSPRMVVAGFGVESLRALRRRIVAERREHRSPLWSGGRSSDHAATPGLWAVEPHLGFHGVGVKFEELMVVTETDAYWLDDDLPHVRFAAKAA